MQPANLLRIDTLTEEWSDKDNVLLHACFQLLTDCIEKEHLLDGHVSWDDRPSGPSWRRCTSGGGSAWPATRPRPSTG